MTSTGTESTTKEVSPEERILYIIQNTGSKGINDSDIQKEIPSISAEERVSIVNNLITQGLIYLFNSNKGLIYKPKDGLHTQSVALKGADNEERVVFGIIEEAGNKGIWIRDIRFKSNLMMTTLGKILKQLEGKKMIKAVKSVAASKKKVYMLYNLEPDRSLTGGAWYCDQDFEAEFVDVLNQQCYRYLQQRKEKTIPIAKKNGPFVAQTMAFATSKDVWKFITDLGISKVQLSEDDIKTILDTLLYDGKIERILNVNGSYLYQSVESYLPHPGIVQMPCGVCSIMHSCSDISMVNAKKCSYFSEWLS